MSTRESHRYLRRSRSPARSLDTRRSRSPRARHRSSKKHPPSTRPTVLPFQAPWLHKQDYNVYKPMFGLYLEIQKQIDLETIPDSEGKGRWKSFVRKWNLGELAEGWYDPATLQKARTPAAELSSCISPPTSRSHSLHQGDRKDGINANESSDDDFLGPVLPAKDVIAANQRDRKSGPAIPNLHDLELQHAKSLLPEMLNESLSDRRELLRQDRLHDRKLQKERLDDLIPRAEAGSKERALEKKREKAESNRAFASTRAEAGIEDMPDADLLGSEDTGIEGFKQQKRELERKKNERELRREEILRARRAEGEQRVSEYKAKEERIMSGLVALAKARFG